MTLRDTFINRGLLFILSCILISCGNFTHPNSGNEDSSDLAVLLEGHIKKQSNFSSGVRGIIDYDASFCPAIVVFGDNLRRRGSSCVNWEVDVKSSFEPGGPAGPFPIAPNSPVDLLLPILLESNDHIQATSLGSIHASTSTSAGLDGLIFSAEANSTVRIRGTAEGCDGTKAQTVSQDIMMNTGNRGLLPVFGNNQNLRFLVHPNSNFCRSNIPSPMPSGTRLEYRRESGVGGGYVVGYTKVMSDRSIVRGCSGPLIYCLDQVVAYVSPDQQRWLEALISQARSGNVSSSAFHCDPAPGQETSQVRYTADNQSVVLKSYTDPCASFQQLNDSPAAAQLIQFIDQYRQ